MLRNSQAQNAKLKIELKALESMLESAKFQLKSTQDKVKEENADYEEDKKEDVAAAKKLAEIEEELKVGWFDETRQGTDIYRPLNNLSDFEFFWELDRPGSGSAQGGQSDFAGREELSVTSSV